MVVLAQGDFVTYLARLRIITLIRVMIDILSSEGEVLDGFFENV